MRIGSAVGGVLVIGVGARCVWIFQDAQRGSADAYSGGNPDCRAISGFVGGDGYAIDCVPCPLEETAVSGTGIRFCHRNKKDPANCTGSFVWEHLALGGSGLFQDAFAFCKLLHPLLQLFKRAHFDLSDALAADAVLTTEVF